MKMFWLKVYISSTPFLRSCKCRISECGSDLKIQFAVFTQNNKTPQSGLSLKITKRRSPRLSLKTTKCRSPRLRNPEIRRTVIYSSSFSSGWSAVHARYTTTAAAAKALKIVHVFLIGITLPSFDNYTVTALLLQVILWYNRMRTGRAGHAFNCHKHAVEHLTRDSWRCAEAHDSLVHY